VAVNHLLVAALVALLAALPPPVARTADQPNIVASEVVTDCPGPLQKTLGVLGQLNRHMARSRCRVGWCEFSARLLSPLCRPCSGFGSTFRIARG
jgi:hypothetical protein